MATRPQSFAAALIKTGTAITRERAHLQTEIERRLSKLSHTELCAVKDLVTELVKGRKRLGPRNRRFMDRRQG